MPYKYQIEKGQEHRIFAGAHNLGDGILVSDEPLSSSLLSYVGQVEQDDSGEWVAKSETVAPPTDIAAEPKSTEPAPAEPATVTPPAATPAEPAQPVNQENK